MLLASVFISFQFKSTYLKIDLHQVFDSFVRVFLGGQPEKAVLQHVKHLLSGDVIIAIEVIHMKAV